MIASHLIGPLARATRPTIRYIASVRTALLACALTLALGPFDAGISKDGPNVDLFDVPEPASEEMVSVEQGSDSPVAEP